MNGTQENATRLARLETRMEALQWTVRGLYGLLVAAVFRKPFLEIMTTITLSLTVADAVQLRRALLVAAYFSSEASVAMTEWAHRFALTVDAEICNLLDEQ